MSFKKGDHVKLRTTSTYYERQKQYGVGKIRQDRGEGYEYGNRYEIYFPCGEVRVYNLEDLRLAYDINDKINKRKK